MRACVRACVRVCVCEFVFCVSLCVCVCVRVCVCSLTLYCSIRHTHYAYAAYACLVCLHRGRARHVVPRVQGELVALGRTDSSCELYTANDVYLRLVLQILIV